MKNLVTPCAATLSCHPKACGRSVRAIEARVKRRAPGSLAVAFSLVGQISRLQIPPRRLPCSADGLWRHTCFEAFIAEKGRSWYYEFNFSPSREWAAYGFKSYRDGGPIEDDGLDPRIDVRATANGFELVATVRLDRLPLIQPEGLLRLGLSAVIEENDGTLSYWALKHPPGKPDFHHPDCFALELALPGKTA